MKNRRDNVNTNTEILFPPVPGATDTRKRVSPLSTPSVVAQSPVQLLHCQRVKHLNSLFPSLSGSHIIISIRDTHTPVPFSRLSPPTPRLIRQFHTSPGKSRVSAARWFPKEYKFRAAVKPSGFSLFVSSAAFRRVVTEPLQDETGLDRLKSSLWRTHFRFQSSASNRSQPGLSLPSDLPVSE